MGGQSDAPLDSIELTELHRIYLAICEELGIGADEWRRDLVAAVVMDIAKNERDAGAIHKRAILKLTNS